jgi:peptide subunit release factor 1 (eRF1)
MGTYTQLYVADYPTLSTKSYVDSVVMTIFRESDKRVFERRVSERNQYTWGHLEDKGEIEVVHEYSNTVDNIIQRLNVMGFSLNFIERDFDKGKYCDGQEKQETKLSLLL